MPKPINSIKRMIDLGGPNFLVTEQVAEDIGGSEVVQINLLKETYKRPKDYETAIFNANLRGGFRFSIDSMNCDPGVLFNSALTSFKFYDLDEGGISKLGFRYEVLTSPDGGAATGTSPFEAPWVEHRRNKIIQTIEKIALVFTLEPKIKTMNTILNKLSHTVFVNFIAYDDELIRLKKGGLPCASVEMMDFVTRISNAADFIMNRDITISGFMSKMYAKSIVDKTRPPARLALSQFDAYNHGIQH